MRKLLPLLMLLALPAMGQGLPYRITAGASPATVRICSFPQNGSPCSNFANVYADQAETLPYAQPFFVPNGYVVVYLSAGIYEIQVTGQPSWADEIVIGVGGGGNPGGTNTAVQFNNGGAFGGDATNFYWDATNHNLHITGGFYGDFFSAPSGNGQLYAFVTNSEPSGVNANGAQTVLLIGDSANGGGLTVSANNPTSGSTNAYLDVGAFTGTAVLGNCVTIAAVPVVNTQQLLFGNAPCSSGGSGITLQTNGTNNTSQTVLNFKTSTANAAGITITPSSDSSGGEKFEATASSSIPNSALLNPQAVINGTTCTLGSNCTVQPQGAVDAQTGTTYTIPSGDCGAKLVTFSNTSPVAVTLPQATGSFASCILTLANYNTGTVTITPTTSTIHGADAGGNVALFDDQTVKLLSDGTNWNVGERQKVFLESVQPTASTTYSVTNPSTAGNGTSFGLTMNLPANIPAGAIVRIYAHGNWAMSASGTGNVNINILDNEGTPVGWCKTDNASSLDYNNGANGGHGGNWQLTCTVGIASTGASAVMNNMTAMRAWIADASPDSCGDNGTDVPTSSVAGECYPGYDTLSTRINNWFQTFDDTTSKTLTFYLLGNGTPTNLTMGIFSAYLEIALP